MRRDHCGPTLARSEAVACNPAPTADSLIKSRREKSVLTVKAPSGVLTRLLVEESRRELGERAPPGLPFVVCTRRFVIDVFDACFLQRFVKVLDACVHPLRFFRADPDPHQAHFL